MGNVFEGALGIRVSISQSIPSFVRPQIFLCLPPPSRQKGFNAPRSSWLPALFLALRLKIKFTAGTPLEALEQTPPARRAPAGMRRERPASALGGGGPSVCVPTVCVWVGVGWGEERGQAESITSLSFCWLTRGSLRLLAKQKPRVTGDTAALETSCNQDLL